MKKLFTITLLALFILCVNAFATETRTLTLGNTNTVLLDENNIWLFPSRINDYPNLAVGEFGYVGEGEADLTRLGVHWKFNREKPWVLGTYFENLPAYVPGGLVPDLGNVVDLNLLDNRRINLFYGRRLGDPYFGARLSWLNSKSERDDASETQVGLNYLDVDLGLTAPTGDWDVAANFALGAFTNEDADGDVVSDEDGFYDFSVLGRLFYQVNPNYTLIPHAGFAYSKRGAKYYQIVGTVEDVDLAIKDSRTTMDLGLGVNYTPATNVLAVADFGFMYQKSNRDNEPSEDYLEEGNVVEEYDYTELALPYFKVGLDADVFKWLDIRLGATSYWTNVTDEQKDPDPIDVYKQKSKYAENETYLGFGFHWNRLHIDTYTDPSMFLDGFNFLSGAENSMNFQISAVYEMM